jgi:DNA polymerase-1
MKRPLLVIDGDSFAHRAYHGLPSSIRRRGGAPANAIVGFMNFLLRLYANDQPRAVLVGWDTLDAPTFRHRTFAAYQSGRQFDPELLEQLAVLPQFVAACGFANAKSAGYEADDFLAAAVSEEERRGGGAVVASGDRDAFQLVSPSVTLLHPVRGGEMARIGPAEVRERYAVEPAQVPDFIALRGDPSDKLPGAAGMGPKGAAKLLHRYGTLEAALQDGQFPGQADQLRLYRRIATMDRSAPLPELHDQTPTWARAAALARMGVEQTRRPADRTWRSERPYCAMSRFSDAYRRAPVLECRSASSGEVADIICRLSASTNRQRSHFPMLMLRLDRTRFGARAGSPATCPA